MWVHSHVILTPDYWFDGPHSEWKILQDTILVYLCTFLDMAWYDLVFGAWSGGNFISQGLGVLIHSRGHANAQRQCSSENHSSVRTMQFGIFWGHLAHLWSLLLITPPWISTNLHLSLWLSIAENLIAKHSSLHIELIWRWQLDHIMWSSIFNYSP